MLIFIYIEKAFLLFKVANVIVCISNYWMFIKYKYNAAEEKKIWEGWHNEKKSAVYCRCPIQKLVAYIVIK